MKKIVKPSMRYTFAQFCRKVWEMSAKELIDYDNFKMVYKPELKLLYLKSVWPDRTKGMYDGEIPSIKKMCWAFYCEANTGDPLNIAHTQVKAWLKSTEGAEGIEDFYHFASLTPREQQIYIQGSINGAARLASYVMGRFKDADKEFYGEDP